MNWYQTNDVPADVVDDQFNFFPDKRYIVFYNMIWRSWWMRQRQSVFLCQLFLCGKDGALEELFSLLIDFIAAAPKYFPLKMSANLNGFSPKGKSTGKHFQFFPFDRKVNRTHLRDLWLYWENTKYSRKLASVLRNHKKTWWGSTLLQSSIFII